MTDGLADKMRALANSGHADAQRLRDLAAKLDVAVAKAYGPPPSPDAKAAAKSLLGAWARARRAWCDATGEPLI
jgi:hypothetical protein